MLQVKRLKSWLIALIGLFAFGYVAWFALFFVAHLYVTRHMEWIIGRDVTRGTVEANKGLIRSEEMPREFIDPYLRVGAFPQLDSATDETIIRYSLIGAFFTVVFDASGEVLAVIDNGV